MSFSDRFADWVPWGFGVFIIAGLVHILSVLIMPQLAPHDALARLAPLTPVNSLVVLNNGERGRETLPFEDPATALAVCRYNLTDGPLRLRSSFDGQGLVLMSFRNRFGTAFYAMTDRGTSRGRLEVVIATRAQLDAIEAQDPEDETPSDLRLVSPSREGFAMFRALAPEAGQKGEAEARLKAITCQTEKPPG